MKYLLVLSMFFFSISSINSQETWGYIGFEIPNGNHYGAIELVTENQMHIVADNGYFYKSTNGGEDWAEFDSQVTEYFFDLKFYDTLFGVAVGANGLILKTQNGGESWEQVSSGTSEDLISIAINSNNSIWIVGANGAVLHSEDQGITWDLDFSLTNEKLNSIQFKNENEGYIAGNNGVLFYTSNSGQNWDSLSPGTSDDLFAISLSSTYIFVLAGEVYFDGYDYTYGAYHALRSNDNSNWEDLYLNELGGSGVADMYFQDDNLGFTIDSAALLCDCCYVTIDKSIDSGANWTESFFEETTAATCNANIGYADIKFINQELGFALLGNKILTTNEDIIVAGIDDFYKNSSFLLFPNPTTEDFFNIQFSDVNINNLSVNILDITGKVIYSNVDVSKLMKINTHNFESGIYFVTISRDNNIVKSKKLIIQ